MVEKYPLNLTVNTVVGSKNGFCCAWLSAKRFFISAYIFKYIFGGKFYEKLCNSDGGC